MLDFLFKVKLSFTSVRQLAKTSVEDCVDCLVREEYLSYFPELKARNFAKARKSAIQLGL